MARQSRRTYTFILLLAFPLAATACDSGSGVCEGGRQTGALGSECSTGTGDGAPAAPASGHYEGRMAFSGSDPVTFPLVFDADMAAGSITGTLGFSDSRQCYSGTLSGTISADGVISGSWQATGANDAAEISGTFTGQLAGSGGCGQWDNEAGQSGVWKVGDQVAYRNDSGNDASSRILQDPRVYDPEFSMTPSSADFGCVVGTQTITFTLRNDGNADGIVAAVRFEGTTGFSTDVNGVHFEADEATGDSVYFDSPLVIAPGAAVGIDVLWTAPSPPAPYDADGLLALYTNDFSIGEWLEIRFRAVCE